MILRAAAAGACIAALPLVVILCHEKRGMEQTREELAHYEQLERGYQQAQLYVLKRDAVAGEEVTADMLCGRPVQSQEELTGAAFADREDLLGKRLKISLTKGAALQADLVYEGAPVTEDERSVEIRELYLPQTLHENEFVDVRIVFPNGEDYLVVGHKRVYRIIRDEEGEQQTVQLRFREEELLRYQAARVDTTVYRDCALYAVPYVGEFQQAAEVYYPVNPAVFRLMEWDPNITDLFLVQEEQERRTVLETHLERYLIDEPEDTDAGYPDSVSAEDTTEETGEPLTLYTELPEET